MHEYINFYELLIQQTNLSPTKNHFDFLLALIDSYRQRSNEDLVQEFNALFEENRDRFPEGYSLIDFINTIFDHKNYTPFSSFDAKKLHELSELKSFLLHSLNLWKNEKSLDLLMNKREVID